MKRSLFIAVLTVIACMLTACSADPNTTNSNAEEVNTATTPATAGTPIAGGAQSTAESARALIVDLYLQHEARRGPFFQDKDRALVDRYFAKPLADLIWKNAVSSAGEVGAIDADPLYDAQDTEIKNFAIGDAEIKDDTATVRVAFTNFGKNVAITFALRLIGDAWKIEDIKYPGNHNLLRSLKAAAAQTPVPSSVSTGEFEGLYKVGDTTCIVKPVKMAFEVRWAKGKGFETYFAKGNNVFESEEDPNGGTNEFRFDDDNYNGGTFVRADGTTLPILRAN